MCVLFFLTAILTSGYFLFLCGPEGVFRQHDAMGRQHENWGQKSAILFTLNCVLVYVP